MKLKLIFAAAVFQILAVIAMLAYAYAPIYFGKEILMRTTVYDPRDMFRGDYVRLSYGFAGVYELDKRDSNLSKRQQLHGSKIYAILKQDKDGKYKFDKYSFERPNGGTFLAGMKTQLERISEHIEIFESIDKDALGKIIKEYYN